MHAFFAKCKGVYGGAFLVDKGRKLRKCRQYLAPKGAHGGPLLRVAGACDAQRPPARSAHVGGKPPSQYKKAPKTGIGCFGFWCIIMIVGTAGLTVAAVSPSLCARVGRGSVMLWRVLQ